MINDPRDKVKEFENLPREVAMVNIRVSVLEAAMLLHIRRNDYGTCIVHKIKGQPRRVEWQGSDQLKEEDGLKLAAISPAIDE